MKQMHGRWWKPTLINGSVTKKNKKKKYTGTGTGRTFKLE